MALSKEIQKWFESFKKELQQQGLDLSDPLVTSLLIGADYEKHNDKDKNGNELETFFYTKQDVPFGRLNEAEFNNPEDEKNEINYRTGPETVDYLKNNYVAIDDFSEEEINKLYSYALEGKIFFLGKDVNYQTKRMVYVNNSGECSLSSPVSEIGFGINEEQQKAFFPKLDDPKDLYASYIRDAEAEQFKVSVAEYAEINTELEGSRQYYRSNLLIDYFRNPEFYASQELSEKREKLIREFTVARTDQIYAKQNDIPDHELGWENAVRKSIEDAYENKKSFDELIAQGLIRKANGDKFEKKDDSPWSTALDIADYLADEQNKLVCYDGKTRIGSFRVSPTSMTLKFRKDSPTKDNNYYNPELKNLEKAEITEELKSFVEQLKTVLTNDAGLDTANPSDRARLKGVYQNPKTGEVVERDMLKSWKFASDKSAFNYEDDSDRMPSKLLDDKEGVGNELLQNDMSLTDVINNLRSTFISEEHVHQLYSMMELAKRGCLMLMKPGKTIKDSYPVILDDTGTLKIYQSHREAASKLGKSFSIASDYVSSVKKSNNKAYCAALDAERGKLFTGRYFAQTGNIESVGTDLYNESVSKGMTKEEYLASIMSMPRKAEGNFVKQYNDYLRSEGVNDPIEVRQIGKSERAKREALSLKAQKNYFSMVYDVSGNEPRALEECRKGGFTDAEINKIRTSRDSVLFFTHIVDDPVQRNKDLNNLSLAAGQGVDPNAPGAKDILDRMYARAFNDTVKNIAEFDYSKFLNLSDAELVEKWPQMYDAFIRLGISKSEIDKQLKDREDNKYIDRDAAKKALEMEVQYAGVLYEGTVRMRAIMNPYYSVFPLDEVSKFSKEQIGYGNVAIETDDALMNRFSTFVAEQNPAHSLGVRGNAEYQVVRKFNLPISEAEKMYTFDSEGKMILDTEIAARLQNNEIVFVANKNNKGAVMAFNYDRKTRMGKDAQDVIDKSNGKYDAAIAKINDAVQKHIDSTSCYEIQNVFTSRLLTPVEAYKKVAEEIEEKRFDKQKIVEIIKENHSKAPALGSDEFFELVRPGKEPLSENDKYKMPSENERKARRSLTVKANEAILTEAINVNKAISRPGSLKALNWNPRIVMYAFYKHAPEDQEFNRKLVKTLENGSAEEKTAMFNQRIKEYLKDSSIFDKSYTDEELVENWEKIRTIGVGMGMEYQSFIKEAIANGIVIDSKLRQQADLMHEKAYAYNNYYCNRMCMIASKYYQYGLENLGLEASAMLMSGSDPEMIKAGQDLIAYDFQTSIAIGEMARHSAFSGGEKDVDAVIDENGKVYAPSSEKEYGDIARNGGKLYFVKKNSNEIKMFSYAKTDIFPPEVHEEPLSKSKEEISQMAYDARVSLLDQAKLPDYEKKIEKGLLSAKKALDEVTNPNSMGEFENKLADYLTYLGIKNAYLNKNPDAKTMEQITDEVGMSAFKAGLLKTGFVDAVYNKLPFDHESIQKLGEKEYLGLMDTVRAEYGKKMLENEAKAKVTRMKEIAKLHNERSVERSQVIKTAQAESKRIKSKDVFFNKKIKGELETILQETNLKSMTFDRTSIQSVTLAMMLNQGYTVDEALSDNSRDDRISIGRAAIAAVKRNDVKFLRENLFKGLATLGKYVDEKLSTMDNLSIYELSKPENRGLYVASTLLKDFAQELNNCQKSLRLEDRLSGPKVDKIVNAAEALSSISAKIHEGIVIPGDRSTESVTNVVTGYAGAQIMINYVNRLKNLPENRGKAISSFFGQENVMAFFEMYGSVVPKLVVDPNMPQALKDSIIAAGTDDSLKDYLTVNVEIGKNGPKASASMSSLASRMKFREAQENITKDLPLKREKKKPEPAKEAEPVLGNK